MSVLSKSQSMGVAAVILAVSTLLSRFMGLVRDKIISWQFGAGGESDMYLRHSLCRTSSTTCLPAVLCP